MIDRADLEGPQAYRVDTHDGRLGSVVAVLPRAGGKPGFLLVHSGLLSCALTTVPFSDVEDVDPARRRIVLREVPAAVRGATRDGARDRIVARA